MVHGNRRVGLPSRRQAKTLASGIVMLSYRPAKS